jgi:hypothetical protein
MILCLNCIALPPNNAADVPKASCPLQGKGHASLVVMRNVSHSLLLLAALSAMPFAGAAQSCADRLVSIATPPPGYPSPQEAAEYFGRSTAYMHVFVEGTVTVAFSVTETGEVAEFETLESSYNLVGRNSGRYKEGFFREFHSAHVQRVLGEWRYKPIETACRVTRTFTWEFQDG